MRWDDNDDGALASYARSQYRPDMPTKRTKARARSGPRKTRYVRVRLDYVLRLEEEVDGVPASAFVGPDDINYLIADGLASCLPEGASCFIMPGSKLQMNLDFRRTNASVGPRVSAGKSWKEEERAWSAKTEASR